MEKIILEAWENQLLYDQGQKQETLNLIEKIFDRMESGELRSAVFLDQQWHPVIWVKKAILLYFKWKKSSLHIQGAERWYDKVDLQWKETEEEIFQQRKIRLVPGSIVRRSAYIGFGTILMPSFVNVGAYVGENTMVDTWSTIGSCAQIGRNCHISGGVGIGGVLEPVQSNPVIIEDECFIGARSEIAEGVIVEKGSVISMGVFLGASTKIVDRQTGEIFYGRVPAYSVVVPGVLPPKETSPLGSVTPLLAAAVIIKRVDEKTRAKVSINELLRYHD
jgi:2,3,4,5-tetrahydropyridine-2-carboxylate N-succinyltransferase